MKNTVYKLRNLPIKERRAVLHLSMIACSLVVFGLWTLTLRYDFQSPETKIELEQSARPFVELGSQMAGTYNAFKESNQAGELVNTGTVTELRSTVENGEKQ